MDLRPQSLTACRSESLNLQRRLSDLQRDRNNPLRLLLDLQPQLHTLTRKHEHAAKINIRLDVDRLAGIEWPR